ncbi:hypothetical protein [Leptospira noguchii]|uniref:hypothetical protein n=1 Tax=Leptospira noguchii TaxID=28182 RepID=UPI00030D0747|nr:hypothetical protein [Leptospira noguchii]
MLLTMDRSIIIAFAFVMPNSRFFNAVVSNYYVRRFKSILYLLRTFESILKWIVTKFQLRLKNLLYKKRCRDESKSKVIGSLKIDQEK